MSAERPLFSVDQLIERILATSGPYEFRTFLIGFARPDDYSRENHEERFRNLKNSLGEALEKLWPERVVDFLRPDVCFRVTSEFSVLVESAPIFIAGRYRKLSRQIPAARWIHHKCQGRGCPECAYTGNLCGPSIQELLERPVLSATGGQATRFHGLGREDTDVRMLGQGRPFVLEVFSPKRRYLDLSALAAEMEKGSKDLAEVSRFALTDRSAVNAVKTSAAEKTYRARIETSAPPPADASSRAASLAGLTVSQTSPRRVAVRRGRDTVRKRLVVESRWLGEFEGGYLWEVRAEAGTYIKELISGDGGRTIPSLSDLLGVSCSCALLDVLEVHWNPPWEQIPGSDERGAE